MPAATTKAELLAVTEREWAKLAALMASVPDRRALCPVDGETSIWDVVAHRAHWIDLFFQWLDEGRAGGPVAMPDHGVKWSELKAYNAALRARHAGLDWAAAQAFLEDRHARLLGWMRQASEAELYGGPMPGGTGWTTGRYAEAAGPSHYRSAAKFLRAALRGA